MSDIFYNMRSLTREEQIYRLSLAYSLCDEWWLDVLDCSKSFARERLPDATFNEALSHFVPGALPMCIIRRPITDEDVSYLEVGFRSMETPDYFLWIIVPLDKAMVVLDGLEVLNG